MEKLFLTVLSMSGTASVVILMVLLARLVLRKTPKVFSYALWAVALFRLLCPFAMESAFSLTPTIQVKPGDWNSSTLVAIDFSQREVTITVDDTSVILPDPPASSPAAPGVPDFSQPDVSVTAPPAAPGRWAIAGAVWLSGTVLLLGYSLLSLMKLRRKLVGSVPLAGEENVRLADHIPSPFVLGVVRPQIYLPSDLPESERDYVLLHERTHIRRFDHITRALAWLALAVHWFNPLVWLSFHLAGKDMEMSCDEAVLRKIGRDVRADYSTSLLRLSAGGKLPAGPLAFGGGDLQGRIKNVLRYKKPALWAVGLALIAVVCAGAALATNFSGIQYPPDAGLEDLPADLTFSLNEDGSSVKIEGSVDGISLDHTRWFSPAWFEPYFDDLGYPLGQLWFEMPLCGGEAVCQLDACWTDESRTAVKVTANPMALISSYFPAGSLIFTVDVSEGTLLELDGYIPKLSPNAPELVPTGEEAVRAARIAARLLEEAEEFYHHPAASINSHAFDRPSLPVAYSLNEESSGVYLSGLDCGGAFWGASLDGVMSPRLALPEDGELGCLSIESPRFLGGYFAGARGPALVLYFPGESIPLLAVAFDDYTGGDYDPVSGFSDYDHGFIFFTVDLASGQVRHREISGYSGQSPELSDAEMAESARLLAQLIQGAADYYEDTANPPSALPFNRPMRLWFGSGAGGWSTTMSLHPDGSFEGNFSDADMGVGGPGFQSTEYVCPFHGWFGDIRQVSAGSWSMTLKELTLDTGRPIGEEWIEAVTIDTGDYVTRNHVRYISSAPYGLSRRDGGDADIPLEPGAQFMFYTPKASGKPGGELYGMENESSELYEFWTWWPKRYAISGDGGGTLGCYALRNVEAGYGFFDLKSWGITKDYLAP